MTDQTKTGQVSAGRGLVFKQTMRGLLTGYQHGLNGLIDPTAFCLATHFGGK